MFTPLPRLENYDSTRSDYYETKYALMGSRVVLEAAVKALKLDRDPEFNGGDNLDEAARVNNALRALQKNLTISGVRTTQLVSVSMEAKSPQKAADIANGVAQAFIDYSLAQKQKILLQAQGWNEKMMDDLRDKLDRQKADIDDFLKQNGLLTFRSMDGYETERLGIVINHPGRRHPAPSESANGVGQSAAATGKSAGSHHLAAGNFRSSADSGSAHRADPDTA